MIDNRINSGGRFPVQLKVAIIGIESPEAGGAHNAENLMLEQVRKVLKQTEILVLENKQIQLEPIKSLHRLRGFLRNLHLIFRFNPTVWALAHRFPWIPSSKFERKLLAKKVDLVFFVGAFDRAIELKRIPYIVTIWDLGHRDLPSLPELGSNREFEYREWRIRTIALKAYAIVVDSETTKQKLVEYYGIDNQRILSLPFSPTALENQPKTHRESFAFYPAHFWSHKNHMILFEAIALLISQGKIPRKLKLTGLDRGNLRYLEKKVDELEISEYIEFLGFVSKEELHRLYDRASIMVMPSLLGPTNLPPLESLIRGCPVAVTSSARENLGNWSGVLSINGLDIEAWAEILDSNKVFEEVDTLEVLSSTSQTRKLNTEKLSNLFETFKQISVTFSRSKIN
jgi:glycosyltransferase involved in cell wall biosynthesis